MHLPAITSPLAFPDGGEPGLPVPVMLLGVRVTAYAIIDIAEHRRRATAGLGAVINPALLDRLMSLPTGIPVRGSRDAWRRRSRSRLRQLLAAEKPRGLTRDGWSWLLEEKAYRRWLTGRAGSRAKESLMP